MTFSKAWCGLFTVVGAGIGLTAFFAKSLAFGCQEGGRKVINSFLDASISLSGLNTTITVEGFPKPLHISLGDLHFNLRNSLSQTLVENLEAIPPALQTSCYDLIWEQAAIILVLCAGLSSLTLYLYKKAEAEEQRPYHAMAHG